MTYTSCTCCCLQFGGKLIVNYNKKPQKYKMTSTPTFQPKKITEKEFINFQINYLTSLQTATILVDDKVELDKVLDQLEIEEIKKEID